MIVVTMEIWPGGDSKRRRPLGRCMIGNDGTGNEKYGNYDFNLWGKTIRSLRAGHVEGFPRLRKDAWSLLRHVLGEAGK